MLGNENPDDTLCQLGMSRNVKDGGVGGSMAQAQATSTKCRFRGGLQGQTALEVEFSFIVPDDHQLDFLARTLTAISVLFPLFSLDLPCRITHSGCTAHHHFG